MDVPFRWQGSRGNSQMIAGGPQESWHPAALVKAYARLTPAAKRNWVWWNIPPPATRNSTFADLIEDEPTAVKWHTAALTNYILGLMSPLNREKVTEAIWNGRRMVGAGASLNPMLG